MSEYKYSAELLDSEALSWRVRRWEKDAPEGSYSYDQVTVHAEDGGQAIDLAIELDNWA